MTTPNQSLPTTVETLLGIGAFQIGGGGTTFGQDIDDDFVDALVKIPYATLGTMIDVLQMVLLRLPIEALQAFSSLIPDWLEEPITDVAEAVGLIIDALQARDIPMLLSVFEDFVDDMLDSLGIPVVGDLLDRIFDLTDGFDEWFGDFDGLLSNFDDLLGDFNILDGSVLTQLVGALTGSSGDLTDLTAWVADIPLIGDLVEAITGVIGGDFTDLTSWAGDVPSLADIVESLTGVIGGDYTDIVAWVSDIPVLGEIIELIVEAITGITSGDLTDLDSFFDDVPLIGDLVDALTGTTGDLTDLDGFFSDLFGILGGTGPTGAGVLGDIFDRFQFLGTGGLFDAAQLTNLSNIPAIAQSKITNLTTDLANLLASTTFQDLVDKMYQAINGGSSTGNTVAAVKTALQAIPQGNVTGLTTLAGNVTTGFQNVYNSWFGGSGATGTPAELATTVAAIKDAIVGGYTVTSFTSTNTAWTIPSGTTEMYGAAIGGGGKGGPGQTGTGGSTRYQGGNGGSSGGIVIASPLDISALTPGTSALNITVGAAASSNNTDGGVSRVRVAPSGTILLETEPNANAELKLISIYPTAAQPGAGGSGGDVQDDIALSETGAAGESNGLATGGNGGAGNTNGHGSAGSTGQDGEYTANPKYGGAGGGGGGAGRLQATANVTGGNGGPGGYPGGGGGGGGAARNDPSPGGQIAGAAGTPAAGLVWLVYR